MPAPYNYMSMIPRPDLARSVQAGAMLGEAIGGAINAKQEEDFQKDLQDTLARPGFRSFNDLMAKYPSKAENIQKLNDRMDAAEKESSYKTGIDVYTALETGNTDTAKTILDDQIAAGKNAGRDMRIIENIRTKMDQDPRAAQAGIGLWLAGSDPKRWDETTTAFESRARKEAERQKIEFQSAESRAKAQKAAVDSKFAESNALLDLQKKGYDIKKIQQDIAFASDNQRIALLDKQLQREQNDLKRAEIESKLADAQSARDAKVREKAAEAESAIASIDNGIATVERIFNNPSWRDVVGALEGGEGIIGGALTGLDEQELDAVAAIETLGSQVFLTNAKAFGSTAGLSEKEGNKLQAAAASLTRRQSEESFKQNLEIVKSLMEKARANVFKRTGVPEIPREIPGSAAGAKTFSFTAPNGQTFNFPSQKALDDFKNAAGIR
jgi:hypothetical protein